MFYISSLNDECAIRGWKETYYNKIGITDTKDGVEEFYTNAEVVKLVDDLKVKNIVIYGCYVYGRDKYERWAFCNVITPGKKGDKLAVVELAETNKKKHNPWSLYPIRDYLASLKVNSTVVVDYRFTGDGDRRMHKSSAIFHKTADDTWHFTDAENAYSGSDINSNIASHYMDFPLCCYIDITIF